MTSGAGGFAAGAAAALALLALLGAFRGAPPAALRAPVVGESVLVAQDAESLPADEENAPQPMPRSVPPHARGDAKDLVQRALHSDDLLLRAEAHRLLRHCAFVLAPGAARPLVAPPAWMPWDTVRKADRAWQAAADRCDPLRALPDRDALERRLDPMPAHEHAAAERRWLAETLRTHGGAALMWAGDALAAHVEQRVVAADGDAFEPLESEAVQIARCRLGEDCGPDSDAAHAACLTLGACDGDVPQRVLSALGSRAARERVQRQALALQEALARGDLARYALGP